MRTQQQSEISLKPLEATMGMKLAKKRIYSNDLFLLDEMMWWRSTLSAKIGFCLQYFEKWGQCSSLLLFRLYMFHVIRVVKWRIHNRSWKSDVMICNVNAFGMIWCWPYVLSERVSPYDDDHMSCNNVRQSSSIWRREPFSEWKRA